MPDTHVTTEAEEMYLITIARAVEDGSTPPIAVSDIARVLTVSSVSANQMIKKLQGLGLVEYTPYKGVTLTAEGSVLASGVLRNRRLWGLFLAEHLGLTPERADTVACEMEHVTPDDVADQLASFLGNPGFGPTGKPIPGKGKASSPDGIQVAHAPPGAEVVVLDAAPPYDSFLSSHGADPGSVVSVLAAAPDGSIVLGTTSGRIHLAADAAASIRVKKAP
ncbi:MAG: metal-dependent transcriptional regulator [Acidimicrobiia bacterium]